jgi:hypothetical protein
MKCFAVLFVAIALCSAAPVLAEDAEKNVELLYPLTLRRPVLETLLDLTATHAKGRDERETELAAEIEWHILPRWLLSFEIPAVILRPEDRRTLGGLGDIGIENRVLLFRSLERQTQVTGGFEVRLPSGSKSRGLGGETAIEPFLAGGIKFDRLQLLADMAYEWILNSPEHGERKQELSAGLAMGYELTERFLPLLELKTVRMVRGENDEDGPKLRGKGQVYLTPGFNLELFKETTLRFGVQLPLTKAKEFDYMLHLGVSIEF